MSPSGASGPLDFLFLADVTIQFDVQFDFIAAGIVTWTHIFAPDRIAFAGGVSAAGPILGDRIMAAVRELIMPPYLASLTFVTAELGNDAGLVGAAAFGRGQSSTEQLVA